MKLNLTFVAGLLLAAISLFFSATGLVHLFAGAGIAIMVMAGAFELAKVTITVHLLRDRFRSVVSYPLTLALLCLTVISSVGVYGYLGRAYNVGHKAATVGAGNVTALEQQVTALEADRDRLYAQIEAVPAAQGTNRRRLTATLQPQLHELDERIQVERDSLTRIQTAQLGRDTDVGELRYAASLLGASPDTLAKWVITALAVLLDPLAILLVTASGVKSRASLSDDRQHRVAPHEHTMECTPSNCDMSTDEWYLMHWRNSEPGTCKRPEEKGKTGWFCTGDAGHDGPCAAVPIDPAMLPMVSSKGRLTADEINASYNGETGQGDFDRELERGAAVKRSRVAALQEAVAQTAPNGFSPGLNKALKSHRRRGSKVVANEKHQL